MNTVLCLRVSLRIRVTCSHDDVGSDLCVSQRKKHSFKNARPKVKKIHQTEDNN